MDTIKVAVIGHRFMGRAHTHAYTDLSIFFNTEYKVEKSILCANENDVFDLADRWGYKKAVENWEDVINVKDIDLIDIAAPSSMHAKIAIAAANAGKNVFCEKPLALTIDEAEKMVEAVEKNKVTSMVGFNYRRVPAIAFAKKLIKDGKIGQIHHFRGIYQQDWLCDPAFPLAWRLRKSAAGYGSHGDLGAHVVDLARYLVGDIDEVMCVQETFIKQRLKTVYENGLQAKAGTEMGEVDVDDASSMMVRFCNQNIMGYIETTRYGNGHRNQNRIEINGSKGSIIFDMEKMNELEYFSSEDPDCLQGYKRIQVGGDSFPYTANWWGAGHIIGYGDTFVNQTYDLCNAIHKSEKVNPDFIDGLNCQYVLEAGQISAETQKWEKVKKY